MCGRFTLTGSLMWLIRLLGLEPLPVFADRYNIAPTQPLLAFLYDIDRNRLRHDFLTWGLIPPFVKDPHEISTLINARAETLAEKPSFKNPFRYRRCIIPASGFYEWKKTARDGSQPFYFTGTSSEHLCLAGIWEVWHGEGGEQVNSCAIITVPANRLVSHVHHRMPAILQPEAIKTWLNPETPASQLTRLLVPGKEDLLKSWEVDSYVNSPRNDHERCIRPVKPLQPELF